MPLKMEIAPCWEPCILPLEMLMVWAVVCMQRNNITGIRVFMAAGYSLQDKANLSFLQSLEDLLLLQFQQFYLGLHLVWLQYA